MHSLKAHPLQRVGLVPPLRSVPPMKRLRSLALFAVVAAGFATVALVGQAPSASGAKMSAAAKKYLATLSPEQKKKGTFAFDDKARLAWFFTPQQDKEKNFTRVGVRMEEL